MKYFFFALLLTMSINSNAGLNESPRSDSKSNSAETIKERKTNFKKPPHPALQTEAYKDDMKKINKKKSDDKNAIHKSTKNDLKNLSKQVRKKK